MPNCDNCGLKTKYRLTKADGRPVDEYGEYFVLKLNSMDVNHKKASIAAIYKYAAEIREANPELAQDLRIWAGRCEHLG